MGELKIFKGRSGELMRSVMEVIIPRGGPFPAGASDYDLVPRVEEIVRSYDPFMRKGVPWMLRYIQYSALWHRGRVFTRLTAGEGAAFLEGMEQSPFYYRRMILLLMKLLTMLAFYENDEAAAAIGYNHGCHLKPGKRKKTGGKK